MPPGVSTPAVLFPVTLRDDTLAQFDVTADGRILLNATVPRMGTPMTLVTDWRRLFLKE